MTTCFIIGDKKIEVLDEGVELQQDAIVYLDEKPHLVKNIKISYMTTNNVCDSPIRTITLQKISYEY